MEGQGAMNNRANLIWHDPLVDAIPRHQRILVRFKPKFVRKGANLAGQELSPETVHSWAYKPGTRAAQRDRDAKEMHG